MACPRLEDEQLVYMLQNQPIGKQSQKSLFNCCKTFENDTDVLVS